MGAKIAEGEILAFIDADTVASYCWLRSIVRTFEDENVVAVTGPLLPLENIKRLYLYKIVDPIIIHFKIENFVVYLFLE